MNTNAIDNQRRAINETVHELGKEIGRLANDRGTLEKRKRVPHKAQRISHIKAIEDELADRRDCLLAARQTLHKYETLSQALAMAVKDVP